MNAENNESSDSYDFLTLKAAISCFKSMDTIETIYNLELKKIRVYRTVIYQVTITR